MNHSRDANSSWMRQYERADHVRRHGYRDPFMALQDRTQRRDRFLAVALGGVEIVLLVSAYLILTAR